VRRARKPSNRSSAIRYCRKGKQINEFKYQSTNFTIFQTPEPVRSVDFADGGFFFFADRGKRAKAR
jgi:hypothetical protein